eukprot:7643167-Pyramimonas_sp.AAC.1
MVTAVKSAPMTEVVAAEAPSSSSGPSWSSGAAAGNQALALQLLQQILNNCSAQKGDGDTNKDA